MISPHRSPNEAAADPADGTADGMDYINTTTEIDLKLEPPTNTANSVLDLDPYVGPSTGVATSINHESSKKYWRSVGNIDLASSSRSVRASEAVGNVDLASSSQSVRASEAVGDVDLASSSRAVRASEAMTTITKRVAGNLNDTAVRATVYSVFRPIGMTTTDIAGQIFWREVDTDEWIPAVYHSDISGELIAAHAQEGQYLYPRNAGDGDNDVTSFHKPQQNWGFERHQRPEILHQYEKAGYRNPTYPVPIWIYKNKVVLDFEDHPILAFRNMPATISTKVEGGLQEAICREDSRIDVKDFRARMVEIPEGKGKKKSTRPSLSAISMRRSRFRWRAGYLSWTTRTGSNDIKEYLDRLLPEACKISNSTKGFRDLRRSEVKLMSEKNRGKHLKRAGGRSITVERRKQMDDAFYRSIREAKAREKYLETRQEESMGFLDDEDYGPDGPEENYRWDDGLQNDSYEYDGLDMESHHPDSLSNDNDQDDSFSNEQHTPENNDNNQIDGILDEQHIPEILNDEHDEYAGMVDLREYDPDDDPEYEDDVDNSGGALHRTHDYRFVEPNTLEEAEVVLSTLEPTRMQFLKFVGDAPPFHDRYISYARQWVYLWRHFQEIWEGYGLPGPAPDLIQASQDPWLNHFPGMDNHYD
ncbi:hypothetical protein MMC07_000959 [Pseudocyphellaria aurata]|nr:hypothetical protein [Pseudocyphellaria aurata]